MIFVTVGHQMQFDRLIEMVDRWAGEHQRRDIIAQIGQSRYQPKYISAVRWLSRNEYDQKIKECSGVVAHAGTGTIIQVLGHRKPLLVVPRLSRYQETRNDHQVGTARHFEQQGYVLVARDKQEFDQGMSRLADNRCSIDIGDVASKALLDSIHQFIQKS